MSKHIYDKDGNYVGKQLSDKEHEFEQRRARLPPPSEKSSERVGCGCLLVIAAFLIWLFTF